MEGEAAFRLARASPSLPAKAVEKLDAILKSHACFDPESVRGRRAGGDRRRHGGQRRPQHVNAQRSVVIATTRTAEQSSERSIRSALNKLTRANYTVITRRVVFITCSENVLFMIRTGLEKAYLEPNHSSLYVGLFRDVLESADAPTRAGAMSVFLEQLPTEIVLLSEVLLPNTDPVSNYDEFCATCKVRRRIVGRTATFCGLLTVASISDHLGATPADVYATHENVMRTILARREDMCKDLDSSGAIEVMLESLNAAICTQSSLLGSFRAAIKDIPIDSFPTAKCRFKVMDILQAKHRPAARRTL